MSSFINVLKALLVRFTPTGNITSTNVQDAIVEVNSRIETNPNSVLLTGNQTVGGTKTFTDKVRAPQFATTRQELTPSGNTQTINWNNGSYLYLDLSFATGNVTLTLSNSNTTTYLIEIIQGATPRNLIFPTGTLQGGGGGNTYVGVSNRRDLLAVTWNGFNYLINSVPGYS